jgi:hypothetical protein
MKISYISGISKRHTSAPQRLGSALIGRSHLAGIGDASKPDYHNKEFEKTYQNGIDWYRITQHQKKGVKDLSNAQKAGFRLRQTAFSSLRGTLLLFIKNNGGGIATSMYNAAFRIYPKTLPIPNAAKTGLADMIKAYAAEIGYKIPTAAQQSQITSLIGLKVISLKPLKVTQNREPKDVYTQILGPGQYDLFLKYAAYQKTETDKLNTSYTIPVPSAESINKFNDLLMKWFNFGGNPDSLIGAIIDGDLRSPRGRDANYMMMVVKTRGIKPKDIGLVIRGFASAFVGDRFQWGSDKTYIFGTKKIGSVAAIATWVGANFGSLVTLFGILYSIFKANKGRGESKAMKREIDALLTQGYLYESDYLDLNMPRPAVVQVKRFEIPTVEVDTAALIDVALTLASNSTQAQDLQKQGAEDKNTSDFLKKAVDAGTAANVKTGFTSVALVKIDPKSLLKEGQDYTKFLLPAGAAVAAYLLLFNDKK